MKISNLRLLVLLPLLTLAAAASAADGVAHWPERQRHFFQDGPGLLLTDEQVEEFLAMDVEERDAFMDELCGFARHVYQDLAQREQQQGRAPAGQAFGYWVPPKN